MEQGSSQCTVGNVYKSSVCIVHLMHYYGRAVAAGTAADWSRDMTFVNCSNSRARVLWIGGQWMRCWARMGERGGWGKGKAASAKPMGGKTI